MRKTSFDHFKGEVYVEISYAIREKNLLVLDIYELYEKVTYQDDSSPTPRYVVKYVYKWVDQQEVTYYPEG